MVIRNKMRTKARVSERGLTPADSEVWDTEVFHFTVNLFNIFQGLGEEESGKNPIKMQAGE